MEFTSPFSRIEAILQNILGADNVLEDPLSRAEVILLAILNDTEITEELDYNELSELEALLYAIKESDEECTTIPETRSGKILLKILHGEKYEGETVSRVEELLKEWSHAAAWYTKTIGPSNPISVSDALAEPAVGLKVDLSPIQESSPWIDTVANTTPYLLRPTETTGNTADEKLVGGSVVWNQILRNGDFSDGTNNWVSEDARYTSLSAENNTLSVSVTQKPNQFYSIGMKQSIQYNVIANHKMLYSIDAKLPHASSLLIRGNVLDGSGGSGQVRIGKNLAENVWTKCQTIINANDTVQAYLYYAPVQSVIADYNVGDVIQYRNVMVTDLTQMFANNPAIADYAYSLEQAEAGSGIAWLKAQGFFNKIYYPYNTGSIESTKTSAKKVVGFNVFDGEYEPGAINISTGENIVSNSNNRTKNYIRVLPNTIYCYSNKNVVAGVRIIFYDENKNRVSARSNGNSVPQTFTTPENAHYLRFYWVDISEACINLSDPNRNGEYEPYKEQTYTLGNDELRGLFKLDTTTNKLYTEGDVKTSDGVISRKYAEMTFDGSSDEEITLQSINDSGIANFNMITLPNYVGGVNKCITNRFDAQTTVIALTTTEGRFVNSNGIFFIRIKSSTVSTVEDFRTWLASNPITIIYELATPTTESSTPFTNPQDVYAGGTEEFVDSRDVPIPAGHETIYSNVQEIIGYDEVVITHGTDESDPNPTEYSISFQSMGTVYSGSLDVLNGVLTVDMAEVDLGTLQWVKASQQGKIIFYATLSNGAIKDNPNGMCNKYTISTDSQYTNDKTIRLYGSATYNFSRVAVRDSSYADSDAATFKSEVSGVQLVYELATPLTYNLTQVEVEMLLNGNFLKSDGGVMTLTYKGTNPAILLMNKLRTNALMRKSKELQNGNLQPILPKSKL